MLMSDLWRLYLGHIRTCSGRNPYFQMLLVIVFRWCLMIISCFLCDFVGAQIRILRTKIVFLLKLTPESGPGSLFARGWTRLPLKGFSRTNKKGENNLFLLPLCNVNYNNRSPAAGNDSRNGINCSRWAAIIYELTNNILTNNSVARFYFIMTRIMLFSYSYA